MVDDSYQTAHLALERLLFSPHSFADSEAKLIESLLRSFIREHTVEVQKRLVKRLRFLALHGAVEALQAAHPEDSLSQTLRRLQELLCRLRRKTRWDPDELTAVEVFGASLLIAELLGEKTPKSRRIRDLLKEPLFA